MKILLVGYLLFIMVVALAVAYLVSRLRVRFPARFLVLILIIIASPVIISYLLLSYFYPLPETVVPNILGLPGKDAAQKLEEVGLSVHVEKQYEGQDIVTFQRPEAGRSVKEGRAITIILGRPRTINYLNRPSQEITPAVTKEEIEVTGQESNEGENVQ